MTSDPQIERARNRTIVALALWFAAASVVGLLGWFIQPSGPPTMLLAFVLIPIAGFITAYLTSSAFRAFADNLSLTAIVAAHLWRFIGIGFVIAAFLSRLPMQFGIPEGIGDIIAALGAALLLPSLRKGTASRGWLLAWNIFGLIDLVAAITIGSLYSSRASPLVGPGGVTMQPMAMFPFNLIPTFFVPLFILLHLLTFKKIAQLPARSDRAAPHRPGLARTA